MIIFYVILEIRIIFDIIVINISVVFKLGCSMIRISGINVNKLIFKSN